MRHNPNSGSGQFVSNGWVAERVSHHGEWGRHALPAAGQQSLVGAVAATPREPDMPSDDPLKQRLATKRTRALAVHGKVSQVVPEDIRPGIRLCQERVLDGAGYTCASEDLSSLP
jgi:hypothetical protein